MLVIRGISLKSDGEIYTLYMLSLRDAGMKSCGRGIIKSVNVTDM